MDRQTEQRGFTLLETLVALSVLAISLGIIYQIFGTSLRNMQYAKEYSYAQMFAESKLSELGKGIPVQEGSFEGEIDGKYYWEINVEPQSAGADAIQELVQTYKVQFSIRWDSYGKSRSIDVVTYKLSVEG